jgi:hypothetical protein
MEIINKEILELADISHTYNIAKDKSIIPTEYDIKKNIIYSLLNKGGIFIDIDDFIYTPKELYDLTYSKDEDKIELNSKVLVTVFNIIFALQVEILLKKIFKIDNLDDIPDDISLLIEYSKNKMIKKIFFDGIRKEQLILIIQLVKKYKDYTDFMSECGFFAIPVMYRIIKFKFPDEFMITKIQKSDNKYMFNINFDKDFITKFNSGNIRRIRTEKKGFTEPYNYNGLWTTCLKHFTNRYLEESIKNVKKYSLDINNYFATIYTFRLRKDISNMLLISSNVEYNIKVLDISCKLLNIKLPDNYDKLIENYRNIDSMDNYYLVYILNTINSINTEDKHINGWFNESDSNEIFIENTEKYLDIQKIDNIYKIYQDENDGKGTMTLIYDKNTKYLKNISTYLLSFNYFVLYNESNIIIDMGIDTCYKFDNVIMRDTFLNLSEL